MISLETTIADTCALVRIDSQNPGVQEAACAEWVGNRLVAAGLAPTWHEVLPGRQNLITTVSGNGDAPRLVLLAISTRCPWAVDGRFRRTGVS